jgi:hypothetical protein
MARKTKVVQVTEGTAETNRDHGKTYLLTEMPAAQGLKWVIRGVLALGRANVEVPPGMAEAGMAGWAVVFLRMISSMSFADAEPLLDELMTCVQVMPDERNPAVVRRLVDGDAEEITTLVRLQQEVLALHENFSVAAVLSMLISGTSAPGS